MKIAALSLSALIICLAGVPTANAQKRVPQAANRSRMGAQALSQVKQLALACLILSSDHGDILKLSSATAKEDLSPYIRNDGLWTAPGDSKGMTSYSINVNVAGKSYARILSPAKTVLLYEGSKAKPKFKYDGRAAIGFVDGHAKLVTPSEASKLIWKP